MAHEALLECRLQSEEIKTKVVGKREATYSTKGTFQKKHNSIKNQIPKASDKTVPRNLPLPNQLAI